MYSVGPVTAATSATSTSTEAKLELFRLVRDGASVALAGRDLEAPGGRSKQSDTGGGILWRTRSRS